MKNEEGEKRREEKEKEKERKQPKYFNLQIVTENKYAIRLKIIFLFKFMFKNNFRGHNHTLIITNTAIFNRTPFMMDVVFDSLESPQNLWYDKYDKYSS